MYLIYKVEQKGNIIWDKTKIISTKTDYENYEQQENEIKAQITKQSIFEIIWDFEKEIWLETEVEIEKEEIYADYEETTGKLQGFYNSLYNKNIPINAILITKEMWEHILYNQGMYSFNIEKINEKINVNTEIISAIDSLKSKCNNILVKNNFYINETNMQMSKIKNELLLLENEFDLENENRNVNEEKQILENKINSLQKEIEDLKISTLQLNMILENLKYPCVIDNLDFFDEIVNEPIDPSLIQPTTFELKEELENSFMATVEVYEKTIELEEKNKENEKQIESLMMAIVELYETNN